MLNTPFSGWPSFSEEEVDAVTKVLRSNKVNYWTGNECREFESEFSAWVGTKHAIALANGTLALDAALLALGIGRGDDVIVSPRTYIASASCVVTAGARPVFADVDPESQNITADTIRAVLTSNTKAVICVHLAGWPCDMDPIMKLAEEYDLKIVEDCAQAHGAIYRGRKVGSIGHIGAWSFCQDKIMTTGGEGGMVTTNDRGLWAAMWSYKDHGKSWEAVYERNHQPGYRWLHESFGSNWRMLEMQAAIGRIQIRRMSEWSLLRTAAAREMVLICNQHSGLRVPVVPAGIQHAYYKFYVFLRVALLADGWTRDRIVDEIVKLGVPCYQGTCPEVYLEKAFTTAGLGPSQRLPVAKNLGECSLMFLVHPTLTSSEIRKTCEVADSVFTRAFADNN